MANENEIELIEKYLNHELSEAEAQSVDKMIREDEALSKEFQRRKTAHLSLDYMLADNLKAQLRGLEEKSKIVSINKKRKQRMYILSIAASLLLLVGAFYFMLPRDGMTSTELASAYYEAPDFGIRGNDAQIAGQEALNSGISAYESGNFEQAIQNFERIPADDAYYVLGRYYLGHAYFAEQAYPQAADNFRLVKEANDLRYTEAAEWYELLSCLASEGSCSTLIDAILTNKNHTYYDETKTINRKRN